MINTFPPCPALLSTGLFIYLLITEHPALPDHS